MEAPVLQIGGILLLPFIVGVIEVLKSQGMPKKHAPLANAILSVGFFVLIQVVAQRPEWESIVVSALQAGFVFLSAMGLYEWQVKPRRARAAMAPRRPLR
jgi:hypothetical protein